MRPLSAVGLVGLLGALAGCGSDSGLPTGGSSGYPPTQEQLNAHASQFKENAQPNRPDPGEKLPLKFLDRDGNEVDLASYRGKKHVVLVIVKGFGAPTGCRSAPGVWRR